MNVGNAGSSPGLVAALEDLAVLLRDVYLRLPGYEDVEATRAQSVRIIEQALLPRLRRRRVRRRPVVLVAGPTGSGKSLLVNSLAGRPIVATSAVRPTTTVATVWAHRDLGDDFWSGLSGRSSPRPAIEAVIGDDPITASATLIDLPPLQTAPADAVLATLLAEADVAMYVTTPLRYADEAGAAFLATAVRIGLPVLPVLNRVPPDAAAKAAVVADAARRLPVAGQPPVVVEEQTQVRPGLLNQAALAPLAAAISALPARLAADADAAIDVALEGLVQRLTPLAAAADEATAACHRLADQVEHAYRDQGDRLAADLLAGDLVLAAPLERAGDRLVAAVTRRAGLAAQAAASSWWEDPVGHSLLAGSGEALWRHGPDIHRAAEAAVERWRESLAGLGDGGRGRRRRRQAAAAIATAVLEGDTAEAGTARAAAGLLATALKEVLALDASRFVAATGDPARLDGAGAEISAALKRVAEEVAAGDDAGDTGE